MKEDERPRRDIFWRFGANDDSPSVEVTPGLASLRREAKSNAITWSHDTGSVTETLAVTAFADPVAREIISVKD